MKKLGLVFLFIVFVGFPVLLNHIDQKRQAQALENFQEAQKSFEKRDFDGAAIYAYLSRAFSSRADINPPEGIDELENKINKARTAENFQEAQKSFEKRDFDGAAIYAYLSRAFSSRADINPPKGIDELEDKIKKAQE